jgi:L,D-peptidoglycan transpeptidase YkuD (ErfK/YbiS/YcfS/YnhG family)|tara:strand:+ start:1733 stop:2242 length:510 start_codon:yes stop_codon:yes gene_type:complete
MNFFVQRSNKKNISYVTYEKKRILCFVGKNGIGRKKREGDLITPVGCYKMTKIYYRDTKVNNLKTGIPIQKIDKKYVWCVDPRNKMYNSLIRTQVKCSHEKLLRSDGVYDIVVVLNFNISPSKKFKGSAIFLHCTDENKKYTAGCVAIKKKDLIDLVRHITPLSSLIIS